MTLKVRWKNSAHIDGGPSGGSSLRKPGRRAPIGRSRIVVLAFSLVIPASICDASKLYSMTISLELALMLIEDVFTIVYNDVFIFWYTIGH